jgi:hypothetical protein
MTERQSGGIHPVVLRLGAPIREQGTLQHPPPSGPTGGPVITSGVKVSGLMAEHSLCQHLKCLKSQAVFRVGLTTHGVTQHPAQARKM